MQTTAAAIVTPPPLWSEPEVSCHLHTLTCVPLDWTVQTLVAALFCMGGDFPEFQFYSAPSTRSEPAHAMEKVSMIISPTKITRLVKLLNSFPSSTEPLG